MLILMEKWIRWENLFFEDFVKIFKDELEFNQKRVKLGVGKSIWGWAVKTKEKLKPGLRYKKLT